MAGGRYPSAYAHVSYGALRAGATLSPGTNKTNCGRPCDLHQVELRDRTGVDHPLVADVGCRNTLFNAVAQSSAEVVADLLQAGVRRFRIELLHDAAERI